MSMVQFYVTNADGDVVRTGWCPEDALAIQALEGEQVHEGSVEVPEQPMVDWSHYKNQRIVNYPSVGDQLDAIFKMAKALQATNELPPEVNAWINACQSVKDQYPK